MLSRSENKISRLSSYIAAVVIALVPFYAFLTVWAGSSFGGYTWIRLWTEMVLVILTIAAASLLVLDKKLAGKLFRKKWFWPIVAFFALEIIWGIVSFYAHNVSLKALGYAWIVDSRYLLFFIVVYIVASKNDFLGNNWRRLIFIPAAIVAVFAVLQFAVLPLNFMTHFGYGTHTIFPYETINHNANYPRAMSFTRGANPLGAYMVIVVALALVALRGKSTRLRRAAYIILLFLSLLALAFSFSRSAWAGAVVAIILLAFLLVKKLKARRIMLSGGLIIVALLVVVTLGLRSNTSFQNYLFHTQENSKVATNSNAGHLSALRNGLDDFASDPLGDGPGTSGPASVYNGEGQVRNTEDYYLTIGEENGWLGLALLLTVFVLVAVELLRRKTRLALGLFAGFAGLFVVNLLLPSWTDVTLAYIFWGLAGVAMVQPVGRPTKQY